MSGISELNKSYGSFFKKTARFAVSPYRIAFKSEVYASQKNNSDHSCSHDDSVKKAIIFCIVLTVIPILPIATILTLGIALLASALVAATAPVTYPAALALDCIF